MWLTPAPPVLLPQFLCDGLEDDMTLRWAEAQAGGEPKTQREREIENYTRASGKMLLLHKLLPKLRAEGRQVRTRDTRAHSAAQHGTGRQQQRQHRHSWPATGWPWQRCSCGACVGQLGLTGMCPAACMAGDVSCRC